jgi:cytochrome c biogenesis protein CcmG/thiol:disulfide interchange protein DsbE
MGDLNVRLRLGWLAVGVLFCAAAVLLYVDYVRYRSGSGLHYGRATIDAAAPDVNFATLDGKRLTLHSYLGKPVLVNFFATWCVPCKAELPLIQSRYVQLHARGLEVLGADEEERAAQVRAFAARHGVTYPVVIDDGAGVNAYGGHAIPTSLFIDRSGVLRAVHVGQMTPDGLDADLAKIL